MTKEFPGMNPFVKIIVSILFYTAVLCPDLLIAQLRGKFEYYSTEAGLSHDAVTCIMKDSEGFIWVGTWNGINRFDGQNFKSFKSTPGDRSQLSSDRITQITEDRSKNLWVKAYDNQVYRFDKSTEQFQPFKIKTAKSERQTAFERVQVLKNGTVVLMTIGSGIVLIPKANQQSAYLHLRESATPNQSIPSNSVNVLHEDLSGNIWVGTSRGVSCFQVKTGGKYTKIVLDAALFLNRNFTAIAEDASTLYFATSLGEILSYQKNTKTIHLRKISNSAIVNIITSKINASLFASSAGGELFRLEGSGLPIAVTQYPGSEKLLSLFEDRSGNIWIEPEKNGVIMYSPIDRVFKKFSNQSAVDPAYKGNNFKIYEDRNGLVWINMKGGGFGYFDGKSIKDFYTIPGLSQGRFASTITSVYYDQHDVLWFSTVDRGLSKAIFLNDQFALHELNSQPTNRSDNEVRGIFADNKCRVWIGVKSGKLFVEKFGKPVAIKLINMPKNGLGQVYAIIGDSKGNIWLGTKSDGLYLASPTDSLQNRYTLTNFRKGAKGSNSLNSNEIYALLEDPQGRIWIGTFNEGLNILEKKGGSTSVLNKDNGLSAYPAEGFRKIRHMSADGHGNIWIATTNGLVVRSSVDVNNNAKKFAFYRKVPGDDKTLGTNDIQYILRDNRNTMWLATSGGGLARATFNDPYKALSFRNYTTRDGLPSDYVLGIAQDGNGNLWAATQNGLVSFNRDAGRFKNYDSYDGLPAATFSEASIQKLADGSLVVGTSSGYISFVPEKVGNRHVQAQLVFTNLQVNNKNQSPSQNGILQADINYSGPIELNHDQNIISIDYTVLDPRSGSRKNFAYRLQGFEELWNSSSQQRATYTNLPPGRYVFEVKSMSRDGDTGSYKSLHILIHPPLWKTWWAYLTYAVLFVVLFEIIRRTIVTMVRLRNRIVVERQLADVKSNFFTHISHELRTPLTLILNPIEVLGDTENLSISGRAQVEIVRKNANRMVRFINQLLDLRKLESGKASLNVSEFELINFLNNIFGYFRELAIRKNISLEVVSAVEKIMIKADQDKIDIVIYNLLSNAFKFSQDNTKINILVTPDFVLNIVKIEVRDQGQGVEDNELDEIFGLYYQAGTNSTSTKGTGIGLALSRELIALHHGSITANKNMDGGLSIIINLPLGKNYPNARQADIVERTEIRPQEMLDYTDQAVIINGLDARENLVLLVEDNAELRDFLARQLSNIYRVEVACDGIEGWDKAMALLPDLILSDIMMPGMSGIELLDKLKNEITTSHIPLVLLSAKHAIENQIEGLRYGADYYITKPFNNQFLLAAIAGLIKQRKIMFSLLVERKSTVAYRNAEPVMTEKDRLFLQKVIDIVDQHMENSEFNIDAVAVSLSMGRSTFYRKFKSLTNQPPVEFVRDMRLKRALQYLDEGEKTISEIAYIVGFSTAKYFSTCFRERYNLSPREYLNHKV